MGYIEKQSSSRLGTTQVVSYTSTSNAVTTAFGGQTFQIRVVSTSDCHVQVDQTPTATTTGSAFLPAKWVEYFTVGAGQKVAAIRASSGGFVTATDGTLIVTEMT